MGKTWKDKPAKKREITIEKKERGSHRKMEPYSKKERKSCDMDIV